MWFESDKMYYEAIVKTHKNGDLFDIMWVKEGQEEPMELKEADQTEDQANEDRWNVVEPVYRVWHIESIIRVSLLVSSSFAISFCWLRRFVCYDCTYAHLQEDKESSEEVPEKDDGDEYKDAGDDQPSSSEDDDVADK